MYQSTQQTSVSTGTWTKVNLQTEIVDTNNDFDNSTNYRFTPTVAGKYLITGGVRVDGASNFTHYTGIYKMVLYASQPHSWSDNSGDSVTTIVIWMVLQIL